MGKQTNQKGSHFGGEWTLQKLHIIEEYLKTYATVLKNQKVKKIYVDGFAGSGKPNSKAIHILKILKHKKTFWVNCPLMLLL